LKVLALHTVPQNWSLRQSKWWTFGEIYSWMVYLYLQVTLLDISNSSRYIIMSCIAWCYLRWSFYTWDNILHDPCLPWGWPVLSSWLYKNYNVKMNHIKRVIYGCFKYFYHIILVNKSTCFFMNASFKLWKQEQHGKIRPAFPRL